MNVERPRRLVVYLNYYYTYGTIETDRREWKIVGIWRNTGKPSHLIQFATRLGLTKENKLVMDVVNKAYGFVSSNYRKGDQVDLFSSDYAGNLDAAEILAKHLHNGTRPGNLSRVRFEDGRNMPLAIGRMPIHCIVVQGLSEMTSISEWNDKLKSRFPSGIRYIVCWDFENGFQSCATRCDVDGSMISRQICVFKGDNGDDLELELELHCNQDIIYYLEPWFYNWDNHEPVWTHKLDSSPSVLQGGPPLEATKPSGMYVHELRKYQGLPGIKGDGSMLVWKSYCSEYERA